MVQHARADDFVESAAQITGPLDGQPGHLEIARLYLRLSASVWRTLVALTSMPTTWDPGSAQGMFGRLRGSAAGNQHLQPLAVSCPGPMQVKIRAAPALLLPSPAIAVEVVTGGG